jgi:hypothetical protein
MQAAKFEEKSYWMTTREYSPGDSLHGEIDVDVAIVAAGAFAQSDDKSHSRLHARGGSDLRSAIYNRAKDARLKMSPFAGMTEKKLLP